MQMAPKETVAPNESMRTHPPGVRLRVKTLGCFVGAVDLLSL